MGSLLSNLPALVFLLALIGFCVFVGFRLGVRFLIRRLAGLVFVVLGVSFVTFILGYLAPGGVVYAQLGQHYTVARGDQLRHLYGLDLPWYEQYAHYLNQLLHLSLGTSWLNSGQTVFQILGIYLPASLELGLWGAGLAIVVGVPLGLLAAVRANTRFDTAIQALALILYALPTFVIIPFYDLAMVNLHSHGLYSLATSGWDSLDQKIAPITIFALGIFAYYLRITRSSMIEVLRQDYVRTARAKGLKERVVVWRHAFRNALIPLLTAIGPALAFAVAGVFIIEYLFNIPGIGNRGLQAITSQDYPVVQGTVILLAFAVVLMNLVTDVAYGFADPRVKTSS
ncbi:MAG TPA: ABC transporter permease [Ktedonobacterales bacterium]|nr:ABC transporter permease [Ktedonobacterales bacterium]